MTLYIPSPFGSADFDVSGGANETAVAQWMERHDPR